MLRALSPPPYYRRDAGHAGERSGPFGPLFDSWRILLPAVAVEIPVMHAEREFGDSKYSFMRLINLMYDPVTLLTTTPLRLLSRSAAPSLAGLRLGLLLWCCVWYLVCRRRKGCSCCSRRCCLCLSARFSLSVWVCLGSISAVFIIYVRACPRYFIQRVVRQLKRHSRGRSFKKASLAAAYHDMGCAGIQLADEL